MLYQETILLAVCNFKKMFTWIQPRNVSPHVREWGHRNPWNSCLWNSESWALESRNSGIPLTIGIQYPSSTDKDWNPRSVAWNPGSKTVPGFPYMWRNVAREWKQQSVELTVQCVSSVKISLLATSILFHANAKFNCINWLDLFAVKIRRWFLTSS